MMLRFISETKCLPSQVWPVMQEFNLSLTVADDDKDAFWLAQVHFSNNNYARALALLLRSGLIRRSTSCRYLAAHCYIKQGKYEQALETLGEQNPDHLLPSDHNSRRRLQNLNGANAKHVTLRNGHTASRKDRIEHSEERERDREQAKDIRFEAAMCYLRGLCYSKRNAFDKAKECFIKAVKIDVQCFEAFDQLMKNSLLKPNEELKLLEELDFDLIQTEDPALAQEAAQFTKLLYTTRLSKYASPAALSEATETLSTHYNLSNNPDLLLSRAETLYTQCRFQEALTITSSILTSESSPSLDDATTTTLGHTPNLYPLHLACLYETASHTTLFLLSHTLSQHAPHEPYTYLAIGTYYLSTHRIPESRRFFSKASLMDPHSAAAWIGFAHTFAAEGEHDQAIAAYSTAVRLFQGSHLPQLFIGMQHLALNNMTTAWEHCVLAFQMSSGYLKPDQQLFSGEEDEGEQQITQGISNPKFPLPAVSYPATNPDVGTGGDPLVLNELGVILYHQANLPSAVQLFRQSLNLATELGWSPAAWVATRANLAHGLRRLGRHRESLAELEECLRICTGGGSAVGRASSVGSATGSTGGTSEDKNLIGSIHTSRGLVLLSLERAQDAVLALHEAVRVLGGDASGGGMAGTLLTRAVEIWGTESRRRDEEETLHTNLMIGRDGNGNAFRQHAQARKHKHLTQEERINVGLDGVVDGMLDRVFRRQRNADSVSGSGRSASSATAGGGGGRGLRSDQTQNRSSTRRRDPFIDN
jgi:anaphase-promoting complex subunit 6